MIDAQALRLLKPVIDWGAGQLHRMGCNADQVTIAGFTLGIGASGAIFLGFMPLGIALILASRALDGLDGALARLCGTTDRGAFLDISLDFLFYASVPLAFALNDPARNALAAAVLLAAFIGTAASFLAFAIIAEKRGLKSQAYPTKSIYYLGGITEGTETIVCFLAMCLWPGQFPLFAFIYAALCVVTAVSRIAIGWKTFAGRNS